MKAILVLDIQQDFTGDTARMPVHKEQAADMIQALNLLTANAGKKGYEVIYIGNEFSASDPLNIFRKFAAIKGRPGSNMDPRLHIINSNYFPKSSSNAFSNKALHTFLHEKKITELIITGLFAEACVWQTMKGALKLNYKVSTIANCVASKTYGKRERMLKRYSRSNIEVLSDTSTLQSN